MKRDPVSDGQRKLHVELLDALSIGISMARRDFSTAGSVMFLLSLGELLEEWTHKKSVDDLARCHVPERGQRVWLQHGETEMYLSPLADVAARRCASWSARAA